VSLYFSNIYLHPKRYDKIKKGGKNKQNKGRKKSETERMSCCWLPDWARDRVVVVV
jgi:hypothetical protein